MVLDPYRIDRDEYAEGTVEMDVLVEEWERFVSDMEPFPLIPRDFRGVLNEEHLNNVKNNTIGLIASTVTRAVEHEYPDLRDVYAETLYSKYSTILYGFFQMMGFSKKTDPRAEIGQNDQYFWDVFVRYARDVAVENVEDLFDYEVALVQARRFSLSFEKKGTKYEIVKDNECRNFTGLAIALGATRLAGQMERGTFSHMGEGFLAVFVNGSDIIRQLQKGTPHIVGRACVGIHNWNTGEGTMQCGNENFRMDFVSSFVDNPEKGVMRHRAHRAASHTKRKVV